MKNQQLILFFSFSLIISCKTIQPVVQQTPKDLSPNTTLKSVEQFTSNMSKYNGFFPFYVDSHTGKVYLEIDKINSEFLFVNSLTTGVGSNDLGLDRGKLGPEKIVRFEKHGNRIFLVHRNYSYRALSADPLEIKSVEEAFATSVLWGFDIHAKSDWSYLIDFSEFLLQDAFGVSRTLSYAKQGTYRVDLKKSTIFQEGLLNFPKNTEFEAIITLSGEAQGQWVRSVTPTPDIISVRQHYSLIELPDSRYEPRVFDPRSGYFTTSFFDYASPISDPIEKRYISRHRLFKKDPTAVLSEPEEPIIYYLDAGTPEPIRTALLEGARWWNEAFESAGYKDAFRVEMMPEGAHPLDVRYNLIQWVHRSTRGWSYGSSITDPRTGEIIKGHVSLGSLRVRQDFLIAQGLLNDFENKNDEMMALALARLRQLSAHEVGHTLGLSHNFASSVTNRASVMDYPYPKISLKPNGEIDLSNAYDTGIGEWDKLAIRYGYSDFRTGNEKTSLEKIINEIQDSGIQYITDSDSRPVSGLHPEAHLWDNGESASAELNRMLILRKKVLDQLSEQSLRKTDPLSYLEEILVPAYMMHRYQIEAAAKIVGGMNYSYAVNDKIEQKMEWISAAEQLEALNVLLDVLTSENLKIREELLLKIFPKADGYTRSRETFASVSGPAWDYFSAVRTLTQHTLNLMIAPERLNRLYMFHYRNPSQPGLDAVIKKITGTLLINKNSDKLSQIVMTETLNHLIQSASSSQLYPEVKAEIVAHLKIRKEDLVKLAGPNETHARFLASQIEQWIQNPEDLTWPETLKAPDGAPIGNHAHSSCSFY